MRTKSLELGKLWQNENCQRNQAVIKKSQPGTANKSEVRFRCPCSKQTKEWNAKQVLEDKTYKFVEDMMVQLLDRKSKSSMKKRDKTYRPLDLPRNIAPVPMPPKEELIKKRKEKDEKQIEARKKRLDFMKEVRENHQSKRNEKVKREEVKAKCKSNKKRKSGSHKIGKKETSNTESQKRKSERPKGSVVEDKESGTRETMAKQNRKRKVNNTEKSNAKKEKKNC